MRTIRVKLDPHSVAQAIEEIRQYQAELDIKVQKLLRTLVWSGKRIARAKVTDTIKHDMFLSNSIDGFIQGNQGFIRVDDKNAVYFEFGTGPVGAKDPHPLADGYKNEGWWTRADGKDMEALYGWKPFGTEGDTYYFTYGQRSNPFMYDTAQELRKRLPQIIAEVFNDK